MAEGFTPDERALLARHTTNLDAPVFALVDLPEAVKGALFARYSRTRKSLRRVLVDEFAGDLRASARLAEPSNGPTTSAEADPAGESPEAGQTPPPSSDGRAEQLYGKVFAEYGDDSVAQLGGAHVAVEGASNLLTKVIEWGRLASYLEQSTRYIAYTDKPDGRYRYYRDPAIMESRHAEAYVRELDAVFDAYTELFEPLTDWARQRFPQDAETPESAYRNAIKAKVCDVLRGLLPAATTSNLGIYASGQAYEHMLLRLRGHDLAEARRTGQALLGELRQVIPAFLTRVDRADRGEVWTDYLATTRDQTRAVATELLTGIAPDGRAGPADDEVTLTSWSPEAELELVTGALYPHSHLPEAQLRDLVAAMPVEERLRVLRAYVGERTNRRHKPGRALERISYRFDIVSDYGTFRDLQRHRMATVEWQPLSPRHGFDTPAEITEAAADRPWMEDLWHRALDRQAQLWQRLSGDFPQAAQYAVGFAYRMRYSLQLNAREAMHLVELRTQPAGHATYRRIAQRMHELIADVAGHRAVADMMAFADHSTPELERLGAEQASAARRAERRPEQRG
jgi:thymidylate synthase ThyX